MWNASALIPYPMTSPCIRAPRCKAVSKSSSTTIPAPSPITKPSRSLSNGRDAFSGSSLRVDSAFMLEKPAIASGVTAASAPPVIIMSAAPD